MKEYSILHRMRNNQNNGFEPETSDVKFKMRSECKHALGIQRMLLNFSGSADNSRFENTYSITELLYYLSKK